MKTVDRFKAGAFLRQMLRKTIRFQMHPQPDETSCGPTCLTAVYDYYRDEADLKKVIREVKALKGGGTLAVLLGLHALRRGFKAQLYSYNLRVFDPTWYKLGRDELIRKLEARRKFQKKPKLRFAIGAYTDFLRAGGTVKFTELSPELIHKHLEKSHPIITGLSSTHLYQSAREYGPDCEYDDVRGEPAGHFVVLYGYDRLAGKIRLADPFVKNPVSKSLYYTVPTRRLINAILLGAITYDANLLILEK